MHLVDNEDVEGEVQIEEALHVQLKLLYDIIGKFGVVLILRLCIDQNDTPYT